MTECFSVLSQRHRPIQLSQRRGLEGCRECGVVVMMEPRVPSACLAPVLRHHGIMSKSTNLSCARQAKTFSCLCCARILTAEGYGFFSPSRSSDVFLFQPLNPCLFFFWWGWWMAVRHGVILRGSAFIVSSQQWHFPMQKSADVTQRQKKVKTAQTRFAPLKNDLSPPKNPLLNTECPSCLLNI